MIETIPRIAIPAPTSGDPEYNERCWMQYAHAVTHSGGLAVCIPLDCDPSEVAKLATSCAAILLPGSPADIQPQKYGVDPHPETAAPDMAREAVDEILLQDSFNLQKPILGVCYGHQAINVWLGGSLCQHLSTGFEHQRSGEASAHTVLIGGNSLTVAAGESGTEIAVNSSHHQAIERPGDGLRIAAVCPYDQTIEAVEGRESESFLLGVQWHPERSYTSDAFSRRVFGLFVAAARRWLSEYGSALLHP